MFPAALERFEEGGDFVRVQYRAGVADFDEGKAAEGAGGHRRRAVVVVVPYSVGQQVQCDLPEQ
ncbi:hypothetical protein OG887_43135 (plasmid) [Streptomyces sp. NBC_00053]|nr:MULTISPECIES: hypothetical protein [unclassified Streptomyces]MCX5506110.1 hypothetical protein [Streptomyces sp. NBC_00052]MCX5554187.1 hypothetical protein [Streptomyces sp. NBC_00051]